LPGAARGRSIGWSRSKEEPLATDTDYREAIYQIAEAIAPTWERRRAEVEEASTPVRECVVLCAVAS
jgi:hypothetical protein